MSRSPFPRLIVSALLLVLATACTSQPAARPVEERFDIATPHGLEEVATRGGHRIFLRPGVRFDDFSRVLIDDFAVSYANARSAADAPPRTLDAETEARLKRTLHDAFAREKSSCHRHRHAQCPRRRRCTRFPRHHHRPRRHHHRDHSNTQAK